MTSQEIIARNDQYVADTYGRFPIALAEGRGARCKDADGKSYIDFTSGIGVNSLGFSDPLWVSAVARQAATLQHTSNLFYTAPAGEIAQLLCEKTGMKKVFFANSGAEANEGAIKCARKYSFDRYSQGRSTVVTLINSFHGRTVTTLAATGQAVFHNSFFPFTEGFRHAPANDLPQTLEALAQPDVCAVMMEMIQGEGGVLPLDKAYVQAVAAYCAQHDLLLLVDEVQTGVGRTGSLYAYQQFDVSPDVVTSAKGLAGGLPIGAVLFNEKTEKVLGKGDHATTFGATPLVCAGAAEVLRCMDEAFLAEVRQKGAYLREKLLAMPHITGVSGLGMMLGATLEGIAAKALVLAGIDQGVLTLTAKEKLRLLPPLTITQEEMDEGLAALNRALHQLDGIE